MTAWDERGGVKIWMREDDQAFVAAPEYWEPLLDAWMKGETFFTVKDLHDGQITLKLAAVVAISFSTPESVRRAKEEEAESKFNED